MSDINDPNKEQGPLPAEPENNEEEKTPEAENAQDWAAAETEPENEAAQPEQSDSDELDAEAENAADDEQPEDNPDDAAEEEPEDKEQDSETEPGLDHIPPVSGRPAVSGKRKKDRKKALFLAGCAALAFMAGLIAYFHWRDSSKDAAAEEEEAQYSQSAMTSSREVTFAPLPDPEPEPEPEPEKEPEPEPEPGPKPVPVMLPAPLPAISAQQTGPDGKPVPTLEEMKFSAPMMGAAPRQRESTEQAKASRGLASDDNTNPDRDLSERMRHVATPQSAATRIKNQSLVLSKGTVIECILESRVDTTVPGMTSCVIPRDIYSMNGRVLLIEKGTKAIGEYQGSVANGLARIFMLWTELRTPHGVAIQLNSPAADALGGAGMGGYVDYHWWKRFGNALLFSLVADAFQFVITKEQNNSNNGDVTYDNTEDGIDEIIQEALRQSGNIPPTLIKNQGERVSIFVARDLSFENVYGVTAYGNH